MPYKVFDIDSLVLVTSQSKLVSVVEVFNNRTYMYYRKMYKLRNIYIILRRTRNISIHKWAIKYFKIRIISCMVNILVETMPFVMVKSESKKGDSVSK